jgi:hypothetical protein
VDKQRRNRIDLASRLLKKLWLQGAVSTAPERTRSVREERMRSGNAADDRSWTGI